MKIRITFEAEYRNPNSPDVYDGSNLKRDLEWVLEDNRESLLWLDTERKTGLFQRDSFAEPTTNVEILGPS